MVETTPDENTKPAPRPPAIRWGHIGRLVLGAVGVLAMIVLLFPGTRKPRPRIHLIGPEVRLTQLSLALNAYATRFNSFPPRAVFAADGTPLLSWRVLLLPFLGEQKLYEQFRLEEPWDSPHNRTLLVRRPSVFDNAFRSNLRGTHTAYLSLQGPGALLSDDPNGLSLSNSHDGMASIAIFSETLQGDVPWTQPVDIDINRHSRIGDPEGMSGVLGAGAYVAFLDGKTLFLPSHCPEDMLRAMVSANGGEPLPSRPDLRRVIDERAAALAAEPTVEPIKPADPGTAAPPESPIPQR
jgi:hypothetical protein